MFRRSNKTAWLTERLISGADCQVWQPDGERREQVREETHIDRWIKGNEGSAQTGKEQFRNLDVPGG